MKPQIVMLIPLGEAPVGPDNTLPGMGGRPDHGLPGGRPDRPDQGLPGHGHPGHALPMPPVDPSWGVGAPPVDPGYGHGHPGMRPGNELPETPVHKPVPPDSAAPPGSIYPPVPGGLPGKSLALVWLVGVGYRWVVLGPSPTPTS